MSTIQDRQALFENLIELRANVLLEAERLLEVFAPRIERTEFQRSAHNLACYLALRRHDLRSLQASLTRFGLSSLGRSESRVRPALDALVQTLGSLCGADTLALPAYPSQEQVTEGQQIISRQAAKLFGCDKTERSTRVMVTLPTEAAESPAWLSAVLRAGAQCVRINCAHDDATVWRRMLDNLRAAEEAAGVTEPVPVLMDLAGPKVRTVRPKKQEKQRYAIGDKLLLTELDVEEVRRRNRDESGGQEPGVVGCTLPAALERLQVGEHVYIDDGQIKARAISRVALGVVLEILQAPSKGRKIRSDRGINFPETELEVASLTEKDHEDLRFVAENASMIGYSFVQTEEDLATLLTQLVALVPAGRATPALVLKIETRRAVRNLPALIVHAAGRLPTAVMIARGDLAIELGFARIAEMQEEILWLCEAAHVPVIWATQVLEGLAKEGLPTRAEVTDAAMAGRAECVMLNKGPHIVEAVQMLAAVLERMQGHQYKKTSQLRVLHAWDDAFPSAYPGAPAIDDDGGRAAWMSKPPLAVALTARAWLRGVYRRLLPYSLGEMVAARGRGEETRFRRTKLRRRRHP